MTRVALLQVPYHLGHEGVGMGGGPDAIVEAGLARALESAGHEVDLVRVAPSEEATNEIAASFDVLRAVAISTREAVERGAFPLVLAANCMTSVGIVAGIGRDVGVVWLDAHPDFNTAEGTTSGFADGMGLSILTGTGWNAMRETVPGYRVVPEERVVLVGIRDIAASEAQRLEGSRLAAVPPGEIDALVTRLDALQKRCSDVYLHLDLDVLDPGEGRANEYAVEGGLSANEVAAALAGVAERFSVRGAAMTAYNPAVDPDDRIPQVALRMATLIVDTSGVPREVAAA
ncbi:MAG: arginase family protein [Actinomycetota bacterium]|nr:arginase family protein [Actinomycetota bacterium]